MYYSMKYTAIKKNKIWRQDGGGVMEAMQTSSQSNWITMKLWRNQPEQTTNYNSEKEAL